MTRIPFVDIAAQQVAIQSELVAAFTEVLESGQLILGEAVETFERQFAAYCGVDHAIGVASGTDALILALKVAGVEPGDEVITVSHSFVATASAIVLAGAKPVFVDVTSDQNIDTALIERAITRHTRAVVPVHLAGKPARMNEVCAIAARYNLAVIEDAAQAVGAEYGGRQVGGWGDFGCFSLHPLKNLAACGDGGVIVTKDGAAADRLRQLRNLGLKDRDHCVAVAGNSRLDAVQAALLSVKLKHLEEIISSRRANAARYDSLLQGIVDLPGDTPGGRDAFHLYVVQSEYRDALHDYLADQGIESRIHYPIPIHRQPPFSEFSVGAVLPETERLSREILSLPIGQTLSHDDIVQVATAIIRFFESRV